MRIIRKGGRINWPLAGLERLPMKGGGITIKEVKKRGDYVLGKYPRFHKGFRQTGES